MESLVVSLSLLEEQKMIFAKCSLICGEIRIFDCVILILPLKMLYLRIVKDGIIG
jgi:hypothetical protein